MHGLSGGLFAVLPHESPDRFEQLHAAFVDEHQPQTITESILVKALTEAWWLRNRAQHYQELCLGRHQADDAQGLPLYIRYQAHHNRLFHRALADLLKLRAAREKSESKKVATSQQQELHVLRIQSARLKIEAQRVRPSKSQPQLICSKTLSTEIGFVPQSAQEAPTVVTSAEAAATLNQ